LLAQSVAGFRDDVVEEQVRDWLRAREISVEIRKEPMLLGDPSPLSAPPLENRSDIRPLALNTADATQHDRSS